MKLNKNLVFLGPGYNSTSPKVSRRVIPQKIMNN